MNEQEIHQHLDPTLYTGMAAKQTEVFLDDIVQEFIESHADLPDPEESILL